MEYLKRVYSDVEQVQKYAAAADQAVIIGKKAIKEGSSHIALEKFKEALSK